MTRDNMLENADSVDWSSVGYPQVPELLKQLTSEDTHIQAEAFERLEAEVVLGGLNWQDFDLGKGVSIALRNDAPLLLVPYLLRLLDPDVPSIKSDVLYLLQRMLYYSHMIDEGNIYKQRAEGVRTAVWEGRLVYLELLSSSDIDIRKSALNILMEFNEPDRMTVAYDLIVCRFEPPLPPSENTSLDD